MRVGINAFSAWGSEKTGVERYSMELIEELRLNSESVFGKEEVFVFVNKGANLLGFEKKLPKNWQVIEVGGLNFFRTQIGLLLALWKHRVEALISFDRALPLFFQGKTIFVLHGLEVWENPYFYPWLPGSRDRFLLRKSLKKADLILAVSRTSKQKAESLLGIDGGKIKVVYQKIIEGEMGEEEDKLNPPQFIFIGRLEKRKNVPNLIRAFNLLREKGVEASLKLIGRPGYGIEEIRREMQHSKFSADIEETGYLQDEEKEEALRQAAVLTMVSYNEGFGRPAAEAILRGLPVVLSDIEVFRELYADWALLASPSNPADIARQMERALILHREDRGGGRVVELLRAANLRDKWSFEATGRAIGAELKRVS